jgi:GNAT superfamily N-acetyltransferase
VRLRGAHLRDLSQVEQIHRESIAQLSIAPPPARLWNLVSQTISALLPLAQETLLYVAEERGKVVGFVQASGQPGPPSSLPPLGGGLGWGSRITALQVLNLCVAAGADEQQVAPALIEHLCEQAGRAGAHRLFVRIPLDDPLLPLFRARGFRSYATESVLYAENPVATSDGAIAGLRPSRSRDSSRLYHLYRAVTPSEVVQLEAPSYRDWKARRPAPSHQEVVDRAGIEAWWGLRRGLQGRPHTFSFLALPETELAARLADHAIVACGAEPAWTSLRHYDSALIDALRGRGFNLLLIQALLVREVTVTEPAAEQAKGLVPSFS